jgi:DUF4097 and DUF4098 domain-containing protein YvlB
MNSLLRFSSAIPLLAILAGFPAEGADFQKSYTLAPGSRIKIENISGNILVSGYDGSAIEVKGIKEGRDKDRVDVEDSSDTGSLFLKARYPQHCNCDASVRFEVQVPRAVSYKFERLSTASGDIEVRDITGDLGVHSASGSLRLEKVTGEVHANTASGDVTVTQIRGSVSAGTASGDVEVEITKLEGSGRSMKITTASGDVNAKLPANPDVDVEISTVSGSIHTDFPIQVHTPEYGPGQSARGRLGNGTYSLHMTTVSGDVHLGRL